MNNAISDLESLVAGLEDNDVPMPPIPGFANDKGTSSNTNKEESHCRLWNEFMAAVEIPRQDSESMKGRNYQIDVDLVETLNQCNFKNATNSSVINAILRVFLLDNLPNLRTLQKKNKPVSLFDTNE